MGELINGRYVTDDQEEIVETLISVAENYWDEELNTDETGVLRTMYEPVAYFFAEMQEDLRLVLDSSQLEFAEDQALDFLVELIGLQRKQAQRATGTVSFIRDDEADVDYLVPKGTVVQNKSVNPIKYRTTEKAVISEGDVGVQNVPIEAVEPGIDGNVGPYVIEVIESNLPGANRALNYNSITGGEERETDEALRERAKDELNGGMKATPSAIINELKRVDGVKSVSLFINDSSEDRTDRGGLPDHHFEAVVQGGDDAEIAQQIADTKAVADGVHSGTYGNTVSSDATLSNGQPYEIRFSRPITLGIEINLTVEIDEDRFSGESFIKNEIVRYIGGTLSSGDEEDGEIRVGDDVIRSEIEHSIMNVNGVVDISNLTVQDEFGTQYANNIEVNKNEVATTNATGSDIIVDTQTS